MKDSECNVDSILSLMGGTIFHFIVGIKIMWGNVAPYITSYLVQFDPTVTYHNTLHVYTAIFLGQSLFMYLGGRLEKRLGPRPTAFLGAFLISGCTYASSYCTSLRALVSLQGMVGVGIGLSYSAPIVCCFGHFRKNKGIVTGIITTGTGAGPFLAGLIATTYVNGENYPVDPMTGLYDPEASPVVGRVPDMFRVLGVMYGCIGLVGASLLMSPPPEEEERKGASLAQRLEGGERAPLNNGSASGNVYDRAMIEETKSGGGGGSIIKTTDSSAARGRGHQRYGSRTKFTTTFSLTTTQMIRDSLCWLVIATAICTGVTGFYISATYKNFGQTAIADDHFLTVVGCLGCLCSGLSRMLWGAVADRIGHFETLELTAYLSPLVLLTYALTVESRASFAACVCSLYALWGASYCLVPAMVAFLFGDEHLGTNYGFVFFTFGVACTAIIDGTGFTGWDFDRINYLFVGVGCLGAVLSSRVRYLTSKITDEKVLKHHRATSSVCSMA